MKQETLLYTARLFSSLSMLFDDAVNFEGYIAPVEYSLNGTDKAKLKYSGKKPVPLSQQST